VATGLILHTMKLLIRLNCKLLLILLFQITSWITNFAEAHQAVTKLYVGMTYENRTIYGLKVNQHCLLSTGCYTWCYTIVDI